MRFSRFISVAFAAVVILPGVSAAQVSLTNIGPKYTGAFTRLGGGFGQTSSKDVGPYRTRLTAAPQSAFDVFCIDADRPFVLTGSYNAYILTFDEAVSSVLSHGGRTNLEALTRVLGTTAIYGGANTTGADYLKDLRTESVLAGLFGQTPNDHWDEIHYAMWGLFSDGSTSLPYTPDGANGLTNANNYFTTAQATSTAAGYNYADWRIIIDANAWDPNYTGPLTQALVTSIVTPEPGTYALVGFGLIGLVGAARRRNRAVKI